MAGTQEIDAAARTNRLKTLARPAVRIVPSILSADLCRLGEDIAAVEAGQAEMLHLDVMDGHFVPNISFGVPVVESVRKHTQMLLDVHLMITDPLKYAEPFAKAGSDLITFHIEVVDEPIRVVDRLRALGVGVGVSLNPATAAEALAPVLDQVDLVLAMTVWPGFGGQEIIEPVLDKVRVLAGRLRPDQRLEVDGGISAGTISKVAEAGADTFVAGSAVFGAVDPAAEVRRLKDLAVAAQRGRI